MLMNEMTTLQVMYSMTKYTALSRTVLTFKIHTVLQYMHKCNFRTPIQRVQHSPCQFS